MTKLTTQDVRSSAEALARELPGVGFVDNGNAIFFRSSESASSQFCNSRGDALRKRCSAFYRSTLTSEDVTTTRCPGGFNIAYLPLDRLTGVSCGIVAHVSKDLTAPSAAITELPRREKARTKQLWSSIPQFDSPNAVERTRSTQQHLSDAFASRRDDALVETITTYKDFVASFCHEALSPIQEVRSTLELAAKRMTSPDTETKQMVSSAIGSLERVRASLEGMRLLFNPDQRPLNNQFRSIDIKGLTEQWCSIYKNQFRQKNITIYFDPNDRAWHLTVIPSSFELLLRNLIDNAIKYSFDASSYADRKEGKIIFRFDRNHLRFSVTSFGVPIAPEEIRSGRIWELAQRGGTSGDRGRLGKGVGLYLVKQIAEQHNATTSVTSEIQNPGAKNLFARNEFAFTFPLR